MSTVPNDPEVIDPRIDETPNSPKPWPKDGNNAVHAPKDAEKLSETLVAQAVDPAGYVSPLGLSQADRIEMRRVILRAADVALKHAPTMHYTEGSLRWSGITEKRRSIDNQYPPYADCSAFATWTYWDASRWKKLGDFLNGDDWFAGYTGTLTQHGLRVNYPAVLSADLVFYGGSLSIPGHVAVYVGNGRVISHGSEAGPLLLPVGYRSDLMQIRRYVL